MKSMHQLFHEFQTETYPTVGKAATLAMRRAFFAGYMAHIDHTIDLLMLSKSHEEMRGKVEALQLSAQSFMIDCDGK